MLLMIKPREEVSAADATPGEIAAAFAVTEPSRDSGYLRGLLFGLTAAALFGSGYVVRKLGLTHYGSPVAGAFIGSLVSLTIIMARATLRGHLDRLLTDNLRRIPWWFVVAGMASGGGLLAQFVALEHLAAWVVSLLQGTQVAWTLLWTHLFLRREERLSKSLLMSSALVLVGIVAVTVDT